MQSDPFPHFTDKLKTHSQEVAKQSLQARANWVLGPDVCCLDRQRTQTAGVREAGHEAEGVGGAFISPASISRYTMPLPGPIHSPQPFSIPDTLHEPSSRLISAEIEH